MKNIVPMKIDDLYLVADMGIKGVPILWSLQFLKLVIKIKMFLCFYSLFPKGLNTISFLF